MNTLDIIVWLYLMPALINNLFAFGYRNRLIGSKVVQDVFVRPPKAKRRSWMRFAQFVPGISLFLLFVWIVIVIAEIVFMLLSMFVDNNLD